MRIIIPKCIRCGSSKSVKNGTVDGWQRYRCKDCGYQYTKQTPQGQPIITRILASSLYLFGLSKREIAAIVGVTPMSIVRWIKRYHIYYMSSIEPQEKRCILSKEEVKKRIDAAPGHDVMMIERTLPSGGRIDVLIYKPQTDKKETEKA